MGKYMKFLFIITIVVVGPYLIIFSVFASEIRHGNYKYQYGVARGAGANTFYICDNCPTIKTLKMSLLKPVLSIKSASPPATSLDKVSSRRTIKKSCSLVSTLYFDFGSFKLRDEERQKLTEISKVLKNDHLNISGYTCDIGPTDVNDRLSVDRAKTVVAFLNTKGVGVNSKNILGKGECCTISDSKDKSRRVEIKKGENCD